MDAHYVGVVPPRELTFSNLNDNIDEEFLNKMCAKFGPLDQVKIYVHPDTKKSMGLAKVRRFSSLHFDHSCLSSRVRNSSASPRGLIEFYFSRDNKVVFTSVRSARVCQDQLDQQTKMGNVMRVDIDTGGKRRYVSPHS